MTAVSQDAPRRDDERPWPDGPAMAAHLPYLRYDAAGRAQVNGRDAAELLCRFGSPLVVFLPDRVEANLRAIADAYGRNFGSLRVFYAVKACYLAPVVAAALAAGAGLEVMSGIEAQIAEHHHLDGAHVVLGGLGRDEDYLARAAALPAALNVIDTAEDLDRLAAAAARHGRVVDVALRLAPPVAALADAMPSDSKLGAPPAQLRELMARLEARASLRLVGLHVHHFTHAASPADYRRALHSAAVFAAEEYTRSGRRFEVIDIGGGLDTRAALAARGLDIQDFARAAATALRPVPYPFTLAVEPGRYAVADAALGLTTVRARKPRGGFTWLIVDLASNLLIPVPGMRYLSIPLRRPVDDEREAVRIADGTCAATTLCPEVLLPPSPPGTPLGIVDCGAYTTVFAHVWGPPPPRIITVDTTGHADLVIDHHQWQAAATAAYGYTLSWGEGT